MTCGRLDGMPVAVKSWLCVADDALEGATMMLEGTACEVNESVAVGLRLVGPGPLPNSWDWDGTLGEMTDVGAGCTPCEVG